MSEIEKRKDDHINLVDQSQYINRDNRFHYEPLLGTHPDSNPRPLVFLDKKIDYPFWISSMTGGGSHSLEINQRMAKVCSRLKIGMGLGSCRVLFDDESKIKDFNLRSLIGDELPFYMNLGLAQVEEFVQKDQVDLVNEMSEKLSTDGVCIHINPLQEFFQPQGDQILISPLETLAKFVESFDGKIIIKEVGQGFGPKSLDVILGLNIDCIELSGFGGTNFTKLEKIRSGKTENDFESIGETSFDMLNFLNKNDKSIDIIVSGGVNNPLDAYYLKTISKNPTIIGQASNVLKHALIGEENLFQYILNFILKMRLAENYLTIKKKGL